MTGKAAAINAALLSFPLWGTVVFAALASIAPKSEALTLFSMGLWGIGMLAACAPIAMAESISALAKPFLILLYLGMTVPTALILGWVAICNIGTCG
jgi:hypothetical protein